MAKINLDLAYAKYKDARGNYVNNPPSGVLSGDTTAELYMTFEQVPVAFITVNKATVNIRRQSSHTTNYIYYGPLTDVASETSKPQLASETLLPVSVDDIGFIDPKTIYLSGNINAYLMYGIGFKGRDNGKTCTIYANSPSYRPYLELDYSVNYTASAKNIKVSHTDITQPTMVTWKTDLQQVSYEVQVLQGENVIFITTGASAQSVSIPANTLLPDLDVIVKIKVSERLLNTNVTSDYAEYNFKPSFTYPTIDNLSYVGDFWERPITVNWRSTDQDGYEYECYYNNEKVSNGTGGKEKSFIIPSNTFNGTLPSSVRIRVYKLYGDNKYYSERQERSLLLRDIEAKISNLIVTGEYWENDITLSWQSTDQQQFKIEVWKDNSLLKTYTGTTDNRYTIPAETLTTGTYTFKVWVGYANRFVNSQSKTIELKDIIPTLSNLSLSGSNIDLQLSLNWTSTYQQKYEIEIYKDDNRVKNYSGTTDKSIIIPHNTLTIGLHKFKVRVAYKDRWTSWQEITATLVETIPSIGVLEPDGVIVDRDNQIRVWWTSINQTEWLLKIDETAYTYQGSYETEQIINPGLLQTGKHKLHLTVTYITAAGVRKTTTKYAEFIVQGKPPIPTFTSDNSFTTNRPTISWDTQEQQGYILEVLQNDKIIWSTGWVNGLITRQKILNYLPNGEYTIRLKIKNEFRLESDYGIKTITINTLEISSIDLTYKVIHNAITLTWNNPDDIFKKFYVIRNGMAIAYVKTDTEYIDYTCNGESTYIIRGITDNDIYIDSNSVTEKMLIKNSVVATLDRLDDMINVGISRNEYSFSGSIELEHTLIHLTGRENPVAVFGEHSTNGYSFKFSTKDKLFRFLEMCRRRQVFCYRDKRQTLYLTVPTPYYTIDTFGAEYNVQAHEIDFNEVVEYD